MANVTDVKTVYNGRTDKVFRFQGAIDTAETDVIKVTIGNFTNPLGQTATYSVVDKIDYSVSGAGYVLLEWDRTVDDEIAILGPGQALIDWSKLGGNIDPRSGGATGNILLSTIANVGTNPIGANNVITYDITLYMRMKA